MGPSVKFVSHIIDDQWFIFKKKWGKFVSRKKARYGGEGFREGFGKRRHFFRFFWHPSLSFKYIFQQCLLNFDWLCMNSRQKIELQRQMQKEL